MKKLLVVGVCCVAMSALAELKLGTVDMMALVKNHPNYESNKKLLLSTEKDYEKRLASLQTELKELQDKGAKLAEEYRNPMLAATAKTKMEEELTQIQNDFMMAQQRLRNEAMRNQQELSELEARLLKAQAEDLKARIQTFAEKHGYDMILDNAAAIYAKASFDVTDDILKSMGVDPKAAKAKEQDESK